MPRAAWESSLSDELWVKIFSILAEDVFDELLDRILLQEEEADTVTNHTKYQSLRLVCKRFHEIFLSHPTLSADLFLEYEPPQAAILSLLERLQRHDVTITRLLAECTRTDLAAVLAGAVTAAGRPLQKLISAVIRSCSVVSLSMLSHCTGLESCRLMNTTCHLDLLALQALPRLSFLHLEAQTSTAIFVRIDSLAHLTRVEAKGAVVQIQQPCLFSSSLQNLSIQFGEFQFMHEGGLFQCTALQSLSLSDCCIAGGTAANTLDIASSPAQLPSSLTSLQQLTALRLNVCSTMSGAFEYPWLPKLTALSTLCLQFDEGTMRFNLTDQILSLTNLRQLSISQALQRHSTDSVLSLEVSWHLLPTLHTLSLFACFLKFDQRVLGLIKMSSLKNLQFSRCQRLDEMTAYHFGALLYNMAIKRPDVTCHLGYHTPQTVFSRFEQAL